MKFRILITILLAALLTSSFSGCSLVRMAEHLDNAADVAEDRIEQASATILTAEQAQAIALKHAGFTADQVQYLRTEYDIDDGMPQYEVQFHRSGFEYDYDIHAETGDILAYDRDD